MFHVLDLVIIYEYSKKVKGFSILRLGEIGTLGSTNIS